MGHHDESGSAGRGTVFVVPTPRSQEVLPFRRAGTETVAAAGGPSEQALPFKSADGAALDTLPGSEHRAPTLPFANDAPAIAPAAHAGWVPGAPWAEAAAPAVPQPAGKQLTLASHAQRQSLVPVLHPDELAAVAFPWLLTAQPLLVVVVKACADLHADAPASLRNKADALCGEVVNDSHELGSIRYPSDFVVMKERADVTLVGHAHPAGGAGHAALVKFAFGDGAHGFERRIAVFGDRRWERSFLGAAPSAPAGYRRMPLCYERAFGGPGHPDNPVGVGFGRDSTLLPNLEDPDQLIGSGSRAPTTTCTAPLRAAWLRPELRSAAEFPAGFEWRGFQQAPPAQRLAAVRGDERFVCEALRPDHPRFSGRLPGRRPSVMVQRRGAMDALDMRIDTVHFDLDMLRVTMVWRARLPLADARASDVIRVIVSLD